MLKFEEMTLAEIEEVELLTGRSIEGAFANGLPKGRALRALYWVAMKRENPDYKFEETGAVTQKQALQMLEGNNPKESK